MKDLLRLAQQCQNDLLSVGIRCGNVRSWTVNTRAKARWGLCKKVGRNLYDIQIAESLLQDNVSDQAAKDTIAHELIHTVPCCFSHTGKWKQLLGFPIWWYVAPTIINTFLESADFSGKKIVLFATSGGSKFGKTVEKLMVSVPDSCEIVEGKLLNGKQTIASIKEWADTLPV